MIQFLEQITQNYGMFLAVLLLTILCGYAIFILLKVIIKKFLGKKEQEFVKEAKQELQEVENEIHDIIIKVIEKPILLLIILIASYLAINTIPIEEPFVKFIDNAFFILSVLISTFVLSEIINSMIKYWLRNKRGYGKKSPQLINKIISLITFIIAILIILSYYQIEITPLVATLGIGGLAVGLALQSTLSNFFAGLNVLSDRPIQVGDFIEMEKDIVGWIEDISWRSTRIRTLYNNFVIIPNSKLSESIITNYSLPNENLAIPVECGVAYESDLEKVEKIALDVAKETQEKITGAVKDATPIFRYYSFDESNIKFRVFLRVENYAAKFYVTTEFIKMLKKRFEQEKIEISWPIRKIYQM